MSDRYYQIETVKKIWDFRNGMHLELRDDCAGLDLLQIRQYEGADERTSISISWEEADLLQIALLGLLEEKAKHGKEEETKERG